jgi:type IV pilus assembly protein PilN
MKLTTNLATRRYVNLKQLNTTLLTGFLVLGALALFLAVQVGQGSAEIRRIRAQEQGLTPKSAGPQISEAQLSAQSKHVQFANQVIDRKTVNWLHLLDSLEEVVPTGVALNQIAPSAERGVSIAGSARNFAALRTLLENMERSKNFSEVYLMSQAQQKAGLTQEGISFTITCRIPLK